MRKSIRLATVFAGVVVLGVSGWVMAAKRPASPPSTADPPAAATTRVVGSGRVEPISEEVEVGVEVPGRITALLVDEGDRVRAGQILATLENRDYRAQVALAEARLHEARAAATRARTGSRPEEIAEARAAVTQAEAVLTQATRESARRESLSAQGVIAREERDRAARDLDVARARLGELRSRLALVEAGPRAEDRAQADAAADAAEATLLQARALLAKTEIRSPIDGTVLRRRVRVGETVSPEVAGTSLFSLADLSRLRVRVEVDEQDVARIALGQQAYVTAGAYGPRRFTGRVSRVGQVLGRKRIRTDDPNERVDTKVLEVLVDLDGSAQLPVGLRMDATIGTR
jgi:ABC exporter DevB family membrane fusion protein